MKKIKEKIITTEKIPHATVREAIQKRVIPKDKSSVIPGLDVNELKHSLDVLKYALDYSEAIVDTVRVPLIVLDKKLRILTANRAFYRTFRLNPKQTESQLIYKLNKEAWNIPKLKLLLEKILPKNSHFDNYQVEINLPHIGLKTMILSARRTYRQVNNTEAILLAFEDITHRQILEKQKDDFIGIVSHELKTPLTTIYGYAQLLERHLNENKDETGAHFLSRMLTQMKRLTQITASFVSVYKIQNGQLRLNKSNFEMEELVDKIVSDFRQTTKSHMILNKILGKNKVYADRERMSQVLINLISNAIKYSPKADKVVINSSHDEKKLTISIQDFGTGISKKDQNKIFERFFRTKAKRESDISGLGLGLYISSEIVRRHGGTMRVTSSGRKGATFYFTLPLKNN